MAAPETSDKPGAPGRWSLHGKTALVTGGTRGIGYPSSTPFSSLATPITTRLFEIPSMVKLRVELM